MTESDGTLLEYRELGAMLCLQVRKATHIYTQEDTSSPHIPFFDRFSTDLCLFFLQLGLGLPAQLQPVSEFVFGNDELCIANDELCS